MISCIKSKLQYLRTIFPYIIGMICFILIITPIYPLVAGDESLKKFRPISKKYAQGKYLLYDCEKRHFACVDEDSFKRCEKSRNLIDITKFDFFPCIAINQYERFKDCILALENRSYGLVRRNKCLTPRKLKKSLNH